MLELANEIRQATLGLNGRVVNHGRVDALAWAAVADALGRDGIWAMSWIVRGYPSPPGHLMNKVRRK